MNKKQDNVEQNPQNPSSKQSSSPTTPSRQTWQKRQPPLKEGPGFDQEVLDALPPIIKEILEISPIDELDGVVVMATFGILSALLPGVEGRFGGKVYHANLYIMILAPPASGKSIVEHVVKVSELVDDEITDGKHDTALGKQGYRGLNLAGNTSKAGLVEELKKLPGCNLLYDSEIDSTAQVMQQEWGGHSDVLRKAAEHEHINEKRKDKDAVKIKNPAVTALLVGTPSQVRGMIEEVHSGLASRFNYYSLHGKKYISESTWQEIDVDGIIKTAKKSALQFFKFHLNNPSTFRLTEDQIEKVDEVFEQHYEDYREDDAMRASAMRLKTTLFRLCMILGAIDKWDRQDTSATYECSDEDFETALAIVETLLGHIEVVIEYIDEGIPVAIPLQQSKVFDHLEDCFSAQDLYNAFEEIVGKRTERTARFWRAKWEQKGLIEKQSSGKYCKK